MAVTPLDYADSGTEPAWNHSIVLPPILALKGVPAGGTILDIGCGNGTMLAEIRLDYSLSRIFKESVDRRRGPLRFTRTIRLGIAGTSNFARARR